MVLRFQTFCELCVEERGPFFVIFPFFLDLVARSVPWMVEMVVGDEIQLPPDAALSPWMTRPRAPGLGGYLCLHGPSVFISLWKANHLLAVILSVIKKKIIIQAFTILCIFQFLFKPLPKAQLFHRTLTWPLWWTLYTYHSPLEF